MRLYVRIAPAAERVRVTGFSQNACAWGLTWTIVPPPPNSDVGGCMGAAGFFDAIKTGDLSRVEALLEADPELASAKDDNGVSAVLTSIYRGQGEIRDMLLAQNPQLEIYDAAATGNLDRVKVLVDKDPSLAKSYSPDGF